MKQLNLFIITFLIGQFIQAQSVGIGTTTPNSSAALEIKSSNKGLLIPTMTSTQRTGIASPLNGLLVYDSTVSKLYQYQAGTWRFLINNDYWVQSTTRKWVYNGTDSIGIGTAAPNERLDVNGNIRSRNNLLADNDITATGSITGGGLVSTGNMLTIGNSLLSGDVTTNSDLIVNNTTATLQLKSSSVNKGFFQLSGNNVRMGTNSGNSSGDLIIRMNGNDRININAQGDMNLEGKITRGAVTGNANLLPVCMGQVSATGGIINGTGNFTVTRPYPSSPWYELSSPLFVSTSIIMVTPINGVDQFVGEYLSPGKLIVLGTADFPFQFVVYNLY